MRCDAWSSPWRPSRAAAVSVDAVQPRAVVPENLALALLRERQLQEEVRRLGEVRVRMRVVRREDEVVVAELLDHVLDLVLVDVDADEALAAEVLAPQRLELRRLPALRHLPVLVEPPAEPGQPAAVALQESDAKPWQALQHPAHGHGRDGRHELDRIVEPAGDGRRGPREEAVDEMR